MPIRRISCLRSVSRVKTCIVHHQETYTLSHRILHFKLVPPHFFDFFYVHKLVVEPGKATSVRQKIPTRPVYEASETSVMRARAVRMSPNIP